MFLGDSVLRAVLVREVLERLVERRRMVEQVDEHVECVENAHRVRLELAALRVLDVDARERVLHFRLLLRQPSHAPDVELDHWVTGSTGSPGRWIPGSLGRWVTKRDPVPSVSHAHRSR